MFLNKKILLLFLCVGFYSCGSVSSNNPGSNSTVEASDWLLPKEEVVNGGVAKDGIPSLDDPSFKQTSEIEYVDDERLILGVKIDGIIKGYPHQVMDHHEIVNDQNGNQPFSLTYCPLTGTGIAWDRTIQGETVEFGVSGLLFRNNLIPYDRKTDSNYSQMQMRGVQGERKGKRLSTFQVIQTTWKTWKHMFPKAKVLSSNTGYDRNYSQYLYGKEYLEENSKPLFPIHAESEKVLGGRPYKERVYGIFQKDTNIEKAQPETFVIDEFGNGINLKNTLVGGTNYVVAGSSDLDFAVAFEKELSGKELDFEPIQDSLPVIMKDQEGNHWDIFGYAVEGPRKGQRLEPALAYYGYWFAFGDFFIWN